MILDIFCLDYSAVVKKNFCFGSNSILNISPYKFHTQNLFSLSFIYMQLDFLQRVSRGPFDSRCPHY